MSVFHTERLCSLPCNEPIDLIDWFLAIKHVTILHEDHFKCDPIHKETILLNETINPIYMVEATWMVDIKK